MAIIQVILKLANNTNLFFYYKYLLMKNLISQTKINKKKFLIFCHLFNFKKFNLIKWAFQESHWLQLF